MNRKWWFLPLLVIIFSIPAFAALFQDSHYYVMHDFQHPARLSVLYQGIKQGIVYPRWVDLWGFGFGNPLFNFYPPLFYYLALPFVFITGSIVMAIKLAVVVLVIIGALGSYLLGKKLINEFGGVVTSLAFTYFGYRAATIYVRGAFAEFTAASILPLSFYLLTMLLENPSGKNIVFWGLSVAAIILGHQIIAVPYLLFAGLLTVGLLIAHRENFKTKIVALSIGFATALGISAFFWLPAILEKQFTLANTTLRSENYSFHQHFVYPIQLWFSQWNFGGSAPGLNDGMSFQLGKFFILAAVASLVWLFFVKEKIQRSKMIEYITVAILTLFSIFLTLQISEFIWNTLPFFSYIQFPWRLFSFTAVWIALLVGYASVSGYEILKKLRIPQYAAMGIIILLISGGMIKQFHYFKPQYFVSRSEEQLTSYDEIAWRVSSITVDFDPVGIKTKKNVYDSTEIDIKKDMVIPRKEFSSPEKNIELISQKIGFNKKVYEISLEEDAQITFHTFNFPGWKAYVDGVEMTINDDNDYKLISLNIPKGKHTILLTFTDAPIRSISWIISGLSLVAIGYLLLRYRTPYV